MVDKAELNTIIVINIFLIPPGAASELLLDPAAPKGYEAVSTMLGRGAVLTPTEQRLLEVLRGQPGRVFPRAELVTLVMPDAVVLERTIDVHVKALRRKLGTGEGSIQTVRRQGYCFVPAP